MEDSHNTNKNGHKYRFFYHKMKPKSKSKATKRLKRARKNAADKADELQAARDRMRKRRQNETDEQRKERLQKHQQYKKHTRQNETPQEHAQRLEQLRVYSQQQRDDESESSRVHNRATARTRMTRHRECESAESHAVRKEQERQRWAQRQNQQSIDDLEASRANHRVAMQQLRDAQNQLHNIDCPSMTMEPNALFESLNALDKDGLTNFFKDIDRSPLKACLLMYLNSGYARFGQYIEFDANSNGDSIDVEAICEEIKNEKLTDSELYNLIDTFSSTHSFTDGNLFACGLCGIREMEIKNRVEYMLMDLNEMEVIHFSSEDTDKLHAMMAKGSITIPTSPESTCEVFPWKAKSFYQSQRYSGRFYHVHPELVELQDNKEYTRVCPSCATKVKDKKVPPLSIANGIDFGNYKRLPQLTEPNLHEQLILSQFRLFQSVIRVQRNTGQQNFTRHNIKANAIMFIHDAPERVIDGLNENSFKSCLKVYFLDEVGKADWLAQKTFKTANILARSFVIKQWLLVFSELNYWFMEYTPSRIDHMVVAAEKSVEAVTDNYSVISDTETRKQDAARGSDVAAVQQRDTTCNDCNSHNERVTNPISGEEEFFDSYSNNSQNEGRHHNNNGVPMRYAFVSPSSNALMANDKLRRTTLLRQMESMLDVSAPSNASHTPTGVNFNPDLLMDPTHSINTSVSSNTSLSTHTNNETLNDSTVSSKNPTESTCSSNQPGVVNSHRLDEPITEFMVSDYILGSAFPHVFLLGTAYDKKMCNLNDRERQHLLKQFTNIPAKSSRLLGYLHDVKKRFAVINGVRTHVQGNSKTIKSIKQLLDNANNQQLFEEAKKDPNGPLAKKIIAKVLPLLNVGGGRIAYGAVETNVALSKIFEMTKRYGPAFAFLTFSFDDIHNPRAIRSSYHTVNNKVFPAVFEESCIHGSSGVEFMAKLREASKLTSVGNITRPGNTVQQCHMEHTLAEAAIQNPVAYVQESKSFIHDVYSILIGIPPEHFHGLTEGVTSRKSRYYKSRNKGVFGHTLAYFGMVEDHQKGTLHYHILLFGSVSPYVLHRFASLPSICDQISTTLESMFKAKLPVNKHIRHLIPKLFRKHNGFKLKTHSLGQLSPPAMLDCANPLGQLQPFGSPMSLHSQICHATNNQAGLKAYHQHMLTCHKGLNGHSGCRLCKPSGSTHGTHPVVLNAIEAQPDEISSTTKSKYTYEVIDPIPISSENQTYKDINPISNQENELIIWEMDRPMPISSDANILTIEQLQDLYSFNEELIRQHVVDLFHTWLDQDPGYPRTSPLWTWLLNAPFEMLSEFYTKLVEMVDKANGYVVDFNPVLLYCTNSHHNASLLGSTEQSNAAMLYVSPYVVKGKMELAMCIAVMEQTRKDINQFPSKADDARTNPSQRQVQHFLTRCLNKMNALVELSDYQVAADLLHLPCQITSELFSNMSVWGSMAYNTHVQSAQQTERFRDRLFSRMNDRIDEMSELDEVDAAFIDDTPHENVNICQNEHECMVDANDDMVHSAETIPVVTQTSLSEEAISQSHVSIEECRERMQDFLVSFGGVAMYTIEAATSTTKAVKMPVPYVAHYNHRGAALRHLNRYEYNSLVHVKERPIQSSTSRSKTFEFASDYPLAARYAQYLRNKQHTIIFNGKPPRHPGTSPDPTTAKYAKWKQHADIFARYYLTAFRPEEICYEGSHQNTYSYDWEALQHWIKTLQRKNCIISKFRLSAMFTRIHSLKAKFKNKVIINKYRARNRDAWSTQQKDRYNTDIWLDQISKFVDTEFIDELQFQQTHSTLSTRITNQLQFQVEDDTAQSAFFNGFITTQLLSSSTTPSTTSLNNIPFIYNDIEKKIILIAKEIFANTTLEDVSIQEFVLDFVDDSLDPPLPLLEVQPFFEAQLNLKQRAVYMIYSSYLDDPNNPEHKPPALVLLTGSAGSGKSYVIQSIIQKAEQNGHHILLTAYNNLNVLDIGGNTLTQLCKLEGRHIRASEYLTLSQMEQLKSSYDFENAKLIIIDEISNVAPHVLARLDDICRQVTQRDIMFGGIPILMVGDLHQKSPVFGKSMPKALLQWTKYKLTGIDENDADEEDDEIFEGMDPGIGSHSRYACTNPVRIGSEIFSKCKWMELTEQQRARDDIEHTSFVHQLYHGVPLNIPFLLSYKELSHDDFNGPTSPWLTAPVIVRTNREKVTMNYKRAIHFAKATGTVVIRWKTKTQSWEQKPQCEDALDQVMEDPAFYEYFVAGAFGYCRDNICKNKDLVNGTKIQYVSLTLSAQDQERIELQLVNAQPGTVFDLLDLPISVNVRLIKLQNTTTTQWQPFSLQQNDVVIPIVAKRCKRRNENKPIPIPGVGGSILPSRLVLLNAFPIELAFAMTVDKSQGQTMDYAIIALSNRRANKCNFDYASVYVAFSRVRHKANLRLLLRGNNYVSKINWLDYLNHLQPNKATKAFFEGFDNGNRQWVNRNWNEKLALEAYNTC